MESTGPAVVTAWEDSKEDKESFEQNQLNDDETLFDKSLLDSLDLAMSPATFSPPLVSLVKPGEGLVLRPLQLGDQGTGFLQLLAQLTTVGDVGPEQWEERWKALRARPDTYFVMVIEDVTTGQVVGAATLVVELKFIHQCGSVGRVEDVVVSTDYRGRQLGKVLVAASTLLAKQQGCYKATLNCTDKMRDFYRGLGFRCEEGDANFMVVRL